MAVTITHSTPADGTFSATGAAAWDATHTVSGLGTMAEQNANNVNITGGSITGVTGVLSSLTVNSTPTSGGAAGQIMFDTGSVLQESSNLLWDNTNKTLTLTGYSLTGSSAFSQLDLSGTWNTTGTPTAIKLTITDTASNASSLLMDLRVGASSIFSVRKSGLVSIPRGSSTVSGYWLSTDSQTGIYAPNNQQLYVAGGGAIVEVRASGLGLGSTALSWGALGATQDLVLTRRGAANLRFGAADAAAPVAQTLSVQSVVAGTSNTAGANLTITGSQGTGTGAGGSIIFQIAPAGTTGTAQNALSTALTIGSFNPVTINETTGGTALTVAGSTRAGTALSGVQITGIAGEFSCSASPIPLSVGQFVTISGTLGGTGSITGYSNPTTYRISATNGTTTFTLVNATSGAAIVTTSGTPTGLTYTVTDPFINLSQTWNNSNVAFQGLRYNVTDTASNASSLFMDLQVGGASRLRLHKDGTISSIISAGSGASFGGNSNWLFVYNTNGSGSGGFAAAIGGPRNGSVSLPNNGAYEFGSYASNTPDTLITRRGTANLRFGAADAAAPVAQTLSVQSVVAGTSNTAGANLTITGSQGTGTGAGGDIIFQTALAGASGTAQNTLITALRIYSNQTVAVGKAYTVATLPAAGTQGRRAWVTDATAPIFLGALTGGGAVVCPVFDNGTAWVAG